MKNAYLVFSLVLGSLPAFGQERYLRPENCLRSAVPLPPGPATFVTGERGAWELLLNGGPLKVKLPDVIGNVEQVCPLRNGRVVVFVGTAVNIVEDRSGAVIDRFGSYNAVISPDQRWIVYTKYYPRNTELPASDVYIVYDLSKSPAENRVPAVSAQFEEGIGKAIYPAGWRNEDGDNIGLPESQQHFLSSQFFWSPGSDAVAFGDRLMGRLNIVVIKIENNGTTAAFVYPVPGPVECSPGASPPSGWKPRWSWVDKIEFGPPQGSDRVIFADVKDSSRGGCASKSLQLHLNGFEPAKSEAPALQKPTRKAKVVDDQTPPQ